MKNSSHIRKAVFLFDAQKNFIRRYDGIVDASKDLGINHSVIQQNIELKTSYKLLVHPRRDELKVDSAFHFMKGWILKGSNLSIE